MIRSMTLTMSLVWGAVSALVAAPIASAADDAALAEKCSGCHGKDGVSAAPIFPIIAGFSAQYIINSMLNFKEHARPCGEIADMCKIAAGLSENDIEALGHYYAEKTFVPAKQEFDAAKAEQGEEIHEAHCSQCHEEEDDDAGLLAGQWTPYLKLTLENFISGQRYMPKYMEKKLNKLSKDDIDALLNYYASKQ